MQTIDPDLVSQLDRIQTVYLNDNRLSYMPQQIETITFTNLTLLTLDGNPFKCDCHSLWFKNWLLKQKAHIPNQDRILCTTGNPVVDTKDSDFVCSESKAGPLSVDDLLAMAFGTVLLIVIITVVICINWTNIQVLLIAKFNIHCFRKKVNSSLKYHVFLSHSSHDNDFVYGEVIPKLENHGPPFRVCQGDRDFVVGRTIAYNIISNIESSLTTLLVISNNFLRSEWCKMEFKQAHMKLLTEKTSNLIMIMLEDPDSELMDKELAYYVRTHVYLKKTGKYFWAKLFHALPVRRQVDTTSVSQVKVSTLPQEQRATADSNETVASETSPLLST